MGEILAGERRRSRAKKKNQARRRGCTPSQLAIAWVLAKGDDIIPIPGTKRRRYLEENAAAADLALTGAELRELEAIFPPGIAQGLRYPETMMGSLDG